MRPAQEVMAELAASGLSAAQIALVIELSATVAAEARPAVDRAAENKRAYDREYRKAHSRKNRTSSYDHNDSKGSNDRDILTSQTPPNVISDEITPPIENPEPEVSPENVIEAWNVMADEAGVPKAKMTPERRKKLKIFVKRHSSDDITEAIWTIPRSPFLRGENDRGWRANLDFLLQPSSFTKIREGVYSEQTT